MREFDQFKVIRINIGHLNKEMIDLLSSVEQNSNNILKKEHGWLIKLNVDSSKTTEYNIKTNCEPEFNDNLQQAIKLAINNGFEAIEFELDGQIMENLPFYME